MRRRTERGTALVTMIVVVGLLMAIGAAVHTGVMADTEMRGAHGRSLGGFYAAEAGINRGIGDYRNIFLAYNVPSGSDFDLHSFMLGQRTVSYQLASVPGNPTVVTVPAGKQFAGLNAIEYKYTANATSALQAGDTEASLGTEFDVDYIPLFQFLAFYAGDLEINPGQAMTLHGPIHTNGSLYTSPTSTTLTIADLQPTIPTVHISAAGDVIHRRKDDPSACTGTINIAKLVDANHDGALDQQSMGTCGVQSNATLATWLGAIRSHQPSVSVPTPDAIARGSGIFWQDANLRIALDWTTTDANGLHPIVALAANGTVDAVQNARLQQFMIAEPGAVFYNDVPNTNTAGACQTGAAGTHSNQNSYTPAYPAANVYPCPPSTANLYPGCAAYIQNETLSTGGKTARRGGFYNNREAAWVKMLNVNVRDLLAWNRAQAAGNQFFPPNTTVNGGVVLFLSVIDATSNGIGNPRLGARVFGSPSVGTNGITVVSDQALYVEGNYNTGTLAGEPKQPAALLGDTINVLSQGWESTLANHNDCQSRLALASRGALNTTIYSAFISGIDMTTVGTYNGGLENYPRFHESWTGRTLVYRGSFVSLGTPRHNNGAWCGTGAACNIYDPPSRNWDYDTDFQDVSKLPPLTPRFVSVQQILFTENFR